MSLVIGIDEAGYGPNLGPLVVTVTVWEVPGDAGELDLWRALRRVISQRPPRGIKASAPRSANDGALAVKARAARLHVADSKQVYNPARGLGPLETSVLALLGSQATFASLADLWRHLCDTVPSCDCAERWFGRDGLALRLPHVADEHEVADFNDRLQQEFETSGVRLRRVAGDIVLTERFNGLIETLGGKGAALSRTTLELLRRAWEPSQDGPALVIADKHGGRSHYQALLADVFGILPMCLEEGLESSRYRLGDSELRFEARGERHLPVAVASMVSKYVRELSMEAFNGFWRQHLPELQPTKGYPNDARRFRAEIAAVQSELGIPDQVLWRER
ncbi:MAG: hypothetical protein U0992_08500 [Planctomycetaceae bacterium]